jgi:hypothetical protein
MYNFLQLNMVNRIVSGMWDSNTDIGGSVFDLATSYDLLFANNLNDEVDSERRKRFHKKRDKEEKPEPHLFSYVVWKKSISLRYFFEVFLFFALVILFQYEVSAFNKDLHVSIDELTHF